MHLTVFSHLCIRRRERSHGYDARVFTQAHRAHPHGRLPSSEPTALFHGPRFTVRLREVTETADNRSERVALPLGYLEGFKTVKDV